MNTHPAGDPAITTQNIFTPSTAIAGGVPSTMAICAFSSSA